jgi:hypothetical protein
VAPAASGRVLKERGDGTGSGEFWVPTAILENSEAGVVRVAGRGRPGWWGALADRVQVTQAAFEDRRA